MSALTLAGAQIVLADDDKGRGSPIGLFVVLVLCIAVYFLYKSLNRHIKRIPESFDQPTDTETVTGQHLAEGGSAPTGAPADVPAVAPDSPTAHGSAPS